MKKFKLLALFAIAIFLLSSPLLAADTVQCKPALDATGHPSACTTAADCCKGTCFQNKCTTTEGRFLELFGDSGSWKQVSVIAVAASLLLVSLAYMAGSIFQSRAIHLWAKNEFSHVVMSLLIIISIAYLVVFASILADVITGTSTGCHAEGCHVLIARQYLTGISDSTKLLGEIILNKNIEKTRSSSTKHGLVYTDIPFVGFSTMTQAGEAMWTDRYRLVFTHLINIMGSIDAQIGFLDYIREGIAPIFLGLGVFLRTFFFTRKLGGLMMATGLALLVIYPLMYVLWFIMLNLNFTVSESLTPVAPSACTDSCNLKKYGCNGNAETQVGTDPSDFTFDPAKPPDTTQKLFCQAGNGAGGKPPMPNADYCDLNSANFNQVNCIASTKCDPFAKDPINCIIEQYGCDYLYLASKDSTSQYYYIAKLFGDQINWQCKGCKSWTFDERCISREAADTSTADATQLNALCPAVAPQLSGSEYDSMANAVPCCNNGGKVMVGCPTECRDPLNQPASCMNIQCDKDSGKALHEFDVTNGAHTSACCDVLCGVTAPAAGHTGCTADCRVNQMYRSPDCPVVDCRIQGVPASADCGTADDFYCVPQDKCKSITKPGATAPTQIQFDSDCSSKCSKNTPASLTPDGCCPNNAVSSDPDCPSAGSKYDTSHGPAACLNQIPYSTPIILCGASRYGNHIDGCCPSQDRCLSDPAKSANDQFDADCAGVGTAKKRGSPDCETICIGGDSELNKGGATVYYAPSSIGLTGTAITPDYSSDIAMIGRLLVISLVAPLFNLLVTISFIRIFSPLLGGDAELPGITKLL
ncbi:Uncharacterised protein [Candidatus Gugararchaeum adminiculabundum]|nr:Uncharacterised protein [Candidatus Gugararchaeum adminiculabundum]